MYNFHLALYLWNGNFNFGILGAGECNRQKFSLDSHKSFVFYFVVRWSPFIYLLICCDTFCLNCNSENETEATTLQLSEAMGAQKEVFITINGDGNDQLPELREWTEPESSQRNGRCNLRESLAWDSAFFTSSGTLCKLKINTAFHSIDRVSFTGRKILFCI